MARIYNSLSSRKFVYKTLEIVDPMEETVLLKKSGADRFARGAPGFFSWLHRKFLAQDLKNLRIQI
jgi:hypothetical protein